MTTEQRRSHEVPPVRGGLLFKENFLPIWTIGPRPEDFHILFAEVAPFPCLWVALRLDVFAARLRCPNIAFPTINQLHDLGPTFRVAIYELPKAVLTEVAVLRGVKFPLLRLNDVIFELGVFVTKLQTKRKVPHPPQDLGHPIDARVAGVLLWDLAALL